MLAWLLEYAGMNPGYLIGGVPQNFSTSARLTDSNFFIIEADEYDTAFFDKRSKFVHYHPRTLIMNNLEFDHADIFADLAAIETQFHHMVRTVPSSGQIIYPQSEDALQRVIERGCWSDQQALDTEAGWQVQALKPDFSEFEVFNKGKSQAVIKWSLTGEHNMNNALAALVAARHVGVEPTTAAEAYAEFQSVKRRMELIGEVDGIRLFDDFAHHPTAIQLTLSGAKAAMQQQGRSGRLVAVLEPRSNTMKMGEHKEALADSVAAADAVFWLQPEGLSWSLQQVTEGRGHVIENFADALQQSLAQFLQSGDDVIIMSNGSFSGLHNKLLQQLQQERS